MKKISLYIACAVALCLLTAFAFWLLSQPGIIQQRQEERQKEMYDKYVELANNLVPRLWPDMNWSSEEIQPPDKFETREAYRVPVYSPFSLADQRVFLMLGIEHDILHIANNEIRKEVKLRRDAGEKATMDVYQVLDKAQYYLDLMNEEIPPDYILSYVIYAMDDELMINDPIWWVIWQPCINGVFFDDADGKYNGDHFIFMTIHEELGLVFYLRKVGIYPPPESMEIKVSPKQAGEVALSLVPEVLKTNIFNTMRGDAERKLRRLVETRLVLFEPNWMLDPKRSDFDVDILSYEIRPPKETRLSWRIEFVLEEEPAPDGSRSMFREIQVWIYIDAKTGECVGADFL